MAGEDGFDWFSENQAPSRVMRNEQCGMME